MLVLTRKVGETIRIGGDVYVTVVKIGANGIRLGIEAPANSSIVRQELLVQCEQPEPIDTELPVQDALPVQDDEG